ncbi:MULTISPECIES: hypothetical protein [Rhodococcus]|uniref:hypothetical protein n=1 Tax=Rhodococcus TaxID=1827 RepID=UPI001AEF3FDB|nr:MULTISPECIES: hypothetical protein [Rhodococcus]MDI9900250.1 hypothetical protein [Rhodococcus sp. IEGM 1409]QTR98359.1 hypothetical protein J6K27_003480 [Rhodococcus qingshengii]WEX03813.1 hypothetical protein P0M12_30115 [Rhodococcus sp. RCBS9]WEX03892.1 hypothetical protein P0M12_00130 [Rhodococcus sp. RCBS9]
MSEVTPAVPVVSDPNVVPPVPGVTPEAVPVVPAAPAPTAPVVPAATAEPQYPEGLGDPGKKALDAERARAEKAERDLKALRDKAAADAKAAEDAKLSELERAQKIATEATAAAEKQAQENLRLNFAYNNGVPKEWVNRLEGSTPEELAADWAILQPTLVAPVAAVDPNAPRVPAPVPSPGPQPSPTKTEDQLLYEQVYGSAPNRK